MRASAYLWKFSGSKIGSIEYFLSTFIDLFFLPNLVVDWTVRTTREVPCTSLSFKHVISQCYATKGQMYILSLQDPSSLKPGETSNQVAWVLEVFEANKVLLDAPRAHETIEEADATRLVVRSARTSTTKRLLTNYGTSALIVVVNVTRSMPESVRGCDQCCAVSAEDCTGKRVRRSGIN
jgi:hypothetical protein